MSDTPSTRNDKKASKPTLSLTRTFLGRIRPDEGDVSRYPRPGDVIQLEGFGGRLKLNDGTEATLKNLVDISLGGVIIFAYPRAHTPGCTKQVCLFRDAYQELTSLGFAIYGLSRDNMRNNGSFSDLHRLPFRLICDEKATLITALGLNKRSAINETMRAVVVLNKAGKVLASMAGNPTASLESIAPVVQTLEQHNNTNSPIDTAQDSFKPSHVASIFGGSTLEEPTWLYRQGSSRETARTQSHDRQVSSRASSKSSLPTPPTQGSSASSLESLTDHANESKSTAPDQSCIVCSRGHAKDQTCVGQVEMIKETIAHLEDSGAMTENCQRELANKLAFVAGELAVIAARIDATYYRPEQNP